MIRILLADDHAIVREGVKRILSEAPGAEVVGEADTGDQALARVAELKPDLVLLDLSMPGRSGLETLREIKSRYPHTRVLVLSMHPEDQFALRLLREGAEGYMTKETAPDELVRAVEKIAAGGKYVSAALAERFVESLGEDTRRPAHDRLSSREYEVMRLLASGKTVTEIGKQLFLSVKTVSTYRQRILEKMSLRNNSELIRYALENQLVE